MQRYCLRVDLNYGGLDYRVRFTPEGAEWLASSFLKGYGSCIVSDALHGLNFARGMTSCGTMRQSIESS